MAQRLDHNESGGITPDGFLEHYRRIRQARMPMETAVGHYRKALQRAKDAGVDTFALAIMEKLSKLGDDQAQLHMRNLFRYSGYTGVDLGQKQGDLFGAEGEQAPSEEANTLFSEQLAEENGYKAGRAREDASTNPHEAGSAACAAWARGWHRGQGEEVMATFKPPKQPTRRSRNPAAETREQPPKTAGEQPQGQADRGEPEMDTSKVVPIGRGARVRAPGGRAAASLTPRQRKAAADSMDKLTGDPVADSKPAF
jgi:hypothetical protein